MKFGELIRNLDVDAVRGPLDVEVRGLACDSREMPARLGLRGPERGEGRWRGPSFPRRWRRGGAGSCATGSWGCPRASPSPGSAGRGRAWRRPLAWSRTDPTKPCPHRRHRHQRQDHHHHPDPPAVPGRRPGLRPDRHRAERRRRRRRWTRSAPRPRVPSSIAGCARAWTRGMRPWRSRSAATPSAWPGSTGRGSGWASSPTSPRTTWTTTATWRPTSRPRPASSSSAERALVNADDPYGRRLLAERPGAACFRSFGLEREADYRVTDLGLSPTGTRLPSADAPGLPGTSRAPCWAASMSTTSWPPWPPSPRPASSWRPSCPGLSRVTGAPGRLDRVDCGQPFGVMVDYAHTPDALEKLLAEGRRLLPPGAACTCSSAAAATGTAASVPSWPPPWRGARTSSGTPPTMRASRTPSGSWTMRRRAFPRRSGGMRTGTTASSTGPWPWRLPWRTAGPATCSCWPGRATSPTWRCAGVKHPYSDRGAVEAVLRGEPLPRPWAEAP